MCSFQLLIALAAKLGLDIYDGDINTAYLNTSLSIKQYLWSVSGYPCKVNGHGSVVQKALYGLHQSGHEWNLELDQWLLENGYQRSRTEPCLYYFVYGDTIVYVLVYVDDIFNRDEQRILQEELARWLKWRLWNQRSRIPDPISWCRSKTDRYKNHNVSRTVRNRDSTQIWVR